MNAEPAKPIERRAERTHLFLVATLYAERSSKAVRVRNLSSSGALIEASDLPSAESSVILRRGQLEAVGTTAWVAAGRAGLSFGAPVDVAAWLPTRNRQAVADQLAFTAQQGDGGAAAEVVAAAGDRPMSKAAISESLAALQAELGRLADALASNAALVGACPELQLFDIAGQRIGRIAAAISAL